MEKILHTNGKESWCNCTPSRQTLKEDCNERQREVPHSDKESIQHEDVTFINIYVLK